MATVFTASMKDDISSVASKMAISLAALDKKASDLFHDSAGNFKQFQKDLRGAGYSAVDATLITKKYQKELVESRKAALGLGKTGKDAWEEIQKATKKAEAEQERAAKKAEQVAKRVERAQVDAAKASEKAWNNSAKGKLFNAISAKDTGVGSAFGSAISYTAAGTTAIAAGAGFFAKDLASAVIEAAEFRQNAITGLEYMLGSRKEAERIFAGAQKLAAETPLDTDKVITGIKQLATAGFSGDESMLLYKAVADQASKNEDWHDASIAAFARIKGRGVAAGEDLESLRVAGFRTESVVQSLLDNPSLAPLFKKVQVSDVAGGKTKWVDRSKASQEDIIKQVRSVMGAGKIGSYTLLNAAIASLEKKENIGQFASKMGAKSLTGTISNFKSAFGDLLKSTNIDEWEGVKAFQDFLTRITTALQSDAGKRLLGTIQQIIDALLGGLNQITSSDINGYVDTISSIGMRAVEWIQEAWGWLDKLLHAESGGFLETLGDVLVDMGKYIGTGIYEGIHEATFGPNVGDVAAKTRGKLMKGEDAAIRDEQKTAKLIADLQAKAASVEATANSPVLADVVAAREQSNYVQMYGIGENAALGFEQGTRDALQIQSPSKTMAYVGEMAAQGLLQGTEKGVEKGNADSVRGGKNVSVIVNVGAVGGDPDAVGQAISNVVVREVMACFERMADEG